MGKNALTSKTIQGILAAGIGLAAPYIMQKTGIMIDDATSADLAGNIISGSGLLWAAYGRTVATGPISWTPKG